MESIRHNRGLVLSKSKGFTLIELMVVFAIISVVTSVVITNQSSFNKTFILANTAYDIALALRSAESYGLGSRAIGGTVNAGYGLHFQRGTNDSFTFFADKHPLISLNCHQISDSSAPNAQPGNCRYDSAQGEKINSYALGNGITISDFCAYTSSGWSCAYAQGGELTSLDIVFARPNPEPFMSVNDSYDSDITKACIIIISSENSKKYILISASGQIVADAGQCS